MIIMKLITILHHVHLITLVRGIT
ncbi:hypothetical protein LINPERPRIM_LOCUS31685 [Linum perenne]